MSYPQVRLPTLTALATHLVRDAVRGVHGKNERLHANDLLAAVPSRCSPRGGVFSAGRLLQLQREDGQRHWLIPARRSLVRERLDPAAGDYRVRMRVTPRAGQADPTLPALREARAIETTRRHGETRILLTALIDAEANPAREVVQQHEER